MSDEDVAARGRSVTGRRKFVAALGAVSGVALAGCSALPWTDDTETATHFSPTEVETVLEDEPAVDYEWPVPVTPTESALEGELERVDDLLAELPPELGPDEIPNGVVRESIVDDRDEAVDDRDEAAAATGEDTYHAIRDARGIRETARNGATAWLAIDADVTELVAELHEERDAVRPQVRDRLESTEYRGTDSDAGRLRAALYAYQRERDFDRVDATLERWRVSERDDVLELGEAAGDLEHATATVDVWDHLDDRYEDRLEDGTDLASAFEDTLERSIDAADFPERDDDFLEKIGLGDLDDQQLEWFLWQASRPAETAADGMASARDDGRLGTGLYHALSFEVAHRAFETIRDRIEAGEGSEESIEDVRDERQEALAAADRAREAVLVGEPLTAPSLGAYVLAETLRSLEWADDGIRRAADTDPDANVSLHSEYRDYVRVRAELEALPDAVERFRERLLAD